MADLLIRDVAPEILHALDVKPVPMEKMFAD